MTDDEIKTLYLGRASEYRVGKRISMKEAIQLVRLDVSDELVKMGYDRFKASVDVLTIRTMLIKDL